MAAKELKKRIPEGLKGLELYNWFPFDEKLEVGGFVKNGQLHCFSGGENQIYWLPEWEAELEYHTHPPKLGTEPVFSYSDILRFLTSPLKTSVLLTWDTVLEVKKTPDSLIYGLMPLEVIELVVKEKCLEALEMIGRLLGYQRKLLPIKNYFKNWEHFTTLYLGWEIRRFARRTRTSNLTCHKRKKGVEDICEKQKWRS